MKHIRDNDALAGLFGAARAATVADDGFTQRVLKRIEPVPPSRNIYRVPTLATALASVLIVVWMAFSGVPVRALGERLASVSEKTGIRLTPVSWTIEKPQNRDLDGTIQ